MRGPFHNTFSHADAEELADAFKALSNATRLQILSLLNKHGEMPGPDIEKHFTLGQSTVLHHLNALTGTGLITSTKRGSVILRALNTDRLTEVADLLNPGGVR